MDPALSETIQEVPLSVTVLASLVLASGILLWLTPLRFRRAELRADTLPGWPIRWIDFGLWLLGLYCVVYGTQVLLFAAMPQIWSSPLPWDLEEGDRQWSVLVGGLSLQLPLLGYFFLMRAYQPGLFRFPLNARGNPGSHTLFRCFILFLLCMPLVAGVNILWSAVLAGVEAIGIPVSRQQQEIVTLISSADSVLPLIGFILMAVILAPMAEELIFRGAIYGFFKSRMPRVAAILVSAFCFGLLHANLASFLPLWFLGVVLTLVYEASGKIRTPILLHALFNAHQLVILVLMTQPLAQSST